jgi:hypothetical protein
MAAILFQNVFYNYSLFAEINNIKYNLIKLNYFNYYFLLVI